MTEFEKGKFCNDDIKWAKALEENEKLKNEIDILKEKNLGQSLQLAKWKDEYADLKTEIEQLKINETGFETIIELQEKKIEQLKMELERSKLQIGDTVYCLEHTNCGDCKYDDKILVDVT